MPDYVYTRKYLVRVKYKHKHFPALTFDDDIDMMSTGMVDCFKNRLDWFNSDGLVLDGWIWIKCLATNEVSDQKYVQLTEENLRCLTKKIQTVE